jgi:hypothetical protein
MCAAPAAPVLCADCRSRLAVAQQYNKGGYLLLDSLIMRGAYGPYGPAKAQVPCTSTHTHATLVRVRRCAR